MHILYEEWRKAYESFNCKQRDEIGESFQQERAATSRTSGVLLSSPLIDLFDSANQLLCDTCGCASSVTTPAVPVPITVALPSRCQGKYLVDDQYLIAFLQRFLSWGPADAIKSQPVDTVMTRNNDLNIKEINNLKWANKLGTSFKKNKIKKERFGSILHKR